jgi:hypothetical protein
MTKAFKKKNPKNPKKIAFWCHSFSKFAHVWRFFLPQLHKKTVSWEEIISRSVLDRCSEILNDVQEDPVGPLARLLWAMALRKCISSNGLQKTRKSLPKRHCQIVIFDCSLVGNEADRLIDWSKWVAISSLPPICSPTTFMGVVGKE